MPIETKIDLDSMLSRDKAKERDEIIDKIKSIVSTKGYVLEASAKKDHCVLVSATEPNRHFWFDDDNKIRCTPEAVRSLQILGLNPIIAPTPSKTTSALDTQVGGSHYKDMKIQPWAVMRATFTRDEMIGYHVGTVMAYLMRHKAKGGEQDIKKAQHHLTELVEYLNAA